MGSREELRRWVEGLARARPTIEREKWARLRSLTTEAALQIYANLCEAAEALPPGPGEIPERLRIQHLLRRQQTFKRASQRRAERESSI